MYMLLPMKLTLNTYKYTHMETENQKRWPEIMKEEELFISNRNVGAGERVEKLERRMRTHNQCVGYGSMTVPQWNSYHTKNMCQ